MPSSTHNRAPAPAPNLTQQHITRKINPALHTSPLFNAYPSVPQSPPKPLKFYATEHLKPTWRRGGFGERLEYADVVRENASEVNRVDQEVPDFDLSLDQEKVVTNIDLDMKTATPLEIQLSQCVITRNNYISDLLRITHIKRNHALLMSTSENVLDLTSEVTILLSDVGDLLTLIRSATLEFVEGVVNWRRSHRTKFKPFKVNGKNYLARLSGDLDFLDKFVLLRRYLGIRLIRNPFLLLNGLDSRLESIRAWEGLPSILPKGEAEYKSPEETGFEGVDWRSIKMNGREGGGGKGKGEENGEGEADDEEYMEIARKILSKGEDSVGGEEPSKGEEPPSTPPSSQTTSSPSPTSPSLTSRVPVPSLAQSAALTSLSTEITPQRLADLALKSAAKTLQSPEPFTVSKSIAGSGEEGGSNNPHGLSLPPVASYAGSTLSNARSLVGLRILRAERVVLQEEGVWGFGGEDDGEGEVRVWEGRARGEWRRTEKERKNQEEKKEKEKENGKEKNPHSHSHSSTSSSDPPPLVVQEDKALHTLQSHSSTLSSLMSKLASLRTLATLQAETIPRVRLRLWWCRRVRKAMDMLACGGEGSVGGSGESPGSSSTMTMSLEELPWVHGHTPSPEFSRAWRTSSDFRRRLEVNEILRLDRLAFVGNGRDIARGTEGRLEGMLVLLNGVVKQTVGEMEDLYGKIEKVEFLRGKIRGELGEMVEERRRRNKGKDDKWVRENRWRLPVPHLSIKSDREWEKRRHEDRKRWQPWIEEYTRPKGGKIDLTRVKREYEKGWLVNGEVPEGSVPDSSTFEQRNERTNLSTLHRPPSTPSTLCVPPSANKFASYPILKAGMCISGQYVLLTLLYKPAKGYVPGCVVIRGVVLAGRAKGMRREKGGVREIVAGRVNEADVVSFFLGSVQKDDRAVQGVLTDEEKERVKLMKPSERKSYIREIIFHSPSHMSHWSRAGLKLCRSMVNGLASGKVRIMWSENDVEGDVRNDVRMEGEGVKEEEKFPIGELGRGGVRLEVFEKWIREEKGVEEVRESTECNFPEVNVHVPEVGDKYFYTDSSDSSASSDSSSSKWYPATVITTYPSGITGDSTPLVLLSVGVSDPENVKENENKNDTTSTNAKLILRPRDEVQSYESTFFSASASARSDHRFLYFMSRDERTSVHANRFVGRILPCAVTSVMSRRACLAKIVGRDIREGIKGARRVIEARLYRDGTETPRAKVVETERRCLGTEYFHYVITGNPGRGYDLPGFTVRLFQAGKRNKNGGKGGEWTCTWGRWGEMGYGGGREGVGQVKKLADLRGFVEGMWVERWRGGRGGQAGIVDLVGVGDVAERGGRTELFEGDGVVDGRNVIVRVDGCIGHGKGGKVRAKIRTSGLVPHHVDSKPIRRGIRVAVQAVSIKSQLRKAVGWFSFDDLKESGYKVSWSEEEGFRMELRVVKRFLKNLVFVRDGKGERKDKVEDKEQAPLGLRLIRGTPTIFKSNYYISGRHCLVSVKFRIGVLDVRLLWTGGWKGPKSVRIYENDIIASGWVELAGQVANTTEDGIGLLIGKLEVGEGGGVRIRKRVEGEEGRKITRDKKVLSSIYQYWYKNVCDKKKYWPYSLE